MDPYTPTTVGSPHHRQDPRPEDPALWNALSDDRRDALEARCHTVRVQDEGFFRSDASLIRCSHRVAGPRLNGRPIVTPASFPGSQENHTCVYLYTCTHINTPALNPLFRTAPSIQPCFISRLTGEPRVCVPVHM